MKRRTGFGMLTAALLVVGAACTGASSGPTGQQVGSGPAAAQKVLDKNASMTIVPVALAGQTSPRVAEVVGMMLERGGMSSLELSQTAFQPPEGADLAATAMALGEFVKAAPPSTDYVLFSAFLGSPKKGVDEVRSVIVAKSGDVVWQDSQTAKDADFARIKPREPMDCCVLVATRLRPVFGLEDPMRADAPAGRLAQRWAKDTGLPDTQELAAIEERQKAFVKAARTATLAVYPPRTGDGVEASAEDVVARIGDAKLMKAVAQAERPAIDVARDMNEQKVLWSMAHNFSAHVKQNPPDADYVLFADYLIGKGPKGEIGVGGVHFAISDRQGNLVLVDFQNSHHSDFQSIKPTSRQDCDALLVKRLASYLK